MILLFIHLQIFQLPATNVHCVRPEATAAYNSDKYFLCPENMEQLLFRKNNLPALKYLC